MSLIDEAALERRMRQIAREEAARPEFVHQRNVEAVLGLPRREFLRLARDGAFTTTKDRRLVLARRCDVASYYETLLATREARPANDANAEAIAFAKVGARRVGS